MKNLAMYLLICMPLLSCGQNESPYITPGPAFDHGAVHPADTFELADDVLIPYRMGDLFGYVNKDREVVIEPQWEMSNPFAHGRATVVGAISQYQSAAALINRQGEPVTEFKYTNIAPSGHPGHWQARLLGGQWGIIDSLGNEIIPIGFESMWYLEDPQWYRVKLNDKSGIIDTNNNILLPIEYDKILYYNGFFNLKQNNKYALYNKQLKQLIPPKYDFIEVVYDGLVYVEDGEKKYILDTLGQQILDVSKYYGLSHYNRRAGITMVSEGDLDPTYWGLIDIETGSELLPNIYGPIYNFHDGFAVVQTKDKPSKYGLINEKGEFVIEPSYGNLHHLRSGQYIAQLMDQEQASMIINQNNEIIYSSPYRINTTFGNIDRSIYAIKNYSPRLKGLIDYNGHVLLKPIYENFTDAGFDSNGLIKVKKDGQYYYMDMKGNEYFDK